MPSLAEMITKSPRGLRSDRIIAFDPGETTGCCMLVGDQIVWSKQLDTSTVPLGGELIHNLLMNELLGSAQPIIVVHEIYRVYSWHKEDHVWAKLHTPRLIGAIELSCQLNGLPLHGQTPQVAKNFCTDSNLKDWGVYERGNPHARDAQRHAIYYAMFGSERSTD